MRPIQVQLEHLRMFQPIKFGGQEASSTFVNTRVNSAETEYLDLMDE